MSLARLRETISWVAPRWHWIGADVLVVFAVFALPVLAAALFDSGVLYLAFGLGGAAAVAMTLYMESSDPNDFDKLSDVTSRLLLPGGLTLGYLVAWWAGLAWAAGCATAFILTVRWTRP